MNLDLSKTTCMIIIMIMIIINVWWRSTVRWNQIVFSFFTMYTQSATVENWIILASDGDLGCRGFFWVTKSKKIIFDLHTLVCLHFFGDWFVLLSCDIAVFQPMQHTISLKLIYKQKMQKKIPAIVRPTDLPEFLFPQLLQPNFNPNIQIN